jgi:hypothetical protein
MNDPDTTPTAEPPIAWRCSWAIAPAFVGEPRPRPDQRDFPTRDGAERFKQQLKRDFPRAVASITPVYFRVAGARQRSLR